MESQDRPRSRKSINFRVHALASSLFKGAQQYYGAHFGVGIPEMRLLSNLGTEGALTATRLVALTAMDKGLVSRLLSALNRRHLVRATAPASDPRRRTWELTESGQALVAALRPVWQRREAVIQASLSNAERDLLEDMLTRMFDASEALRAEEARALRAARGKAKKPDCPAPFP